MRTALALALAAVVGSSCPVRAEDARLVILHTTDLHGAFDDWDYGNDGPAARGLTRIGTLVKRARAEGAPVLVLDAGDAIQGGAASGFARGDHSRPHPVMALMNAIGYDAMAVGNHEFDFGAANREAVRKAARFPWLAANVVRADGGPAFDATMVRRLNGIKVGVVGICTPATPMFADSTLFGGLRFLEPIEPARRAVERLRRVENCDVVVLLAHTGLERDPAARNVKETEQSPENWGYRLAEQVRGVDAVILGHTHAVVPSARVAGTLVTQAGRHGELVGRIDLRLSRTGERTPWVVGEVSSRMLAVSDTLTADPALDALAAPYREDARAALARPIATTKRTLAAPAGRSADSELWQLIHAAQLAHGGADVSLAALPEADVVIPAGTVTGRDLLRLYPYENTLGVVGLTGGQLKDVLERSAAMLAPYDYSYDRPLFTPGTAGYNFDMASGVTYTIDLSRPVGDRIVDLRFKDQPLDPAQALRVAVNSYREFGGGGFPHLPTAPRLRQSTTPVREMIAQYLAAHASEEPAPPSWTLRPAFVTAPERGLLDVLVRRNVLAREDVASLDPARPATRGAFAGWLAKAMPKAGAARAAKDDAQPVTLAMALDRCERVARAAGYALAPRAPDASFRRSLLTGTSLGEAPPAHALTQVQALGLIANLRFPVIRVLETTDFHGAILQTGRERGGDRVVGGSATLAAWVNRLRAENPEGTVLLDGGDWYQGTMISNLQFGRPVIEQMNALDYTAVSIGNHEFDWNADTLQRRIAELEMGAFGANIVERKTNRRPRWAKADTVFTRRGMKVGVMGLAYRHTPAVTLAKYVAHLRFDDDSVTAARLAPALDRRSDVMIGMGHIPSEVDTNRRAHGDLPRLARIPGFDLWVGGHSHNHVLDRVGDVPVLIGGSHGQLVAVCDLVVDGVSRKVVERHPRLQPTFANEVTPDSAMLVRIERWNRDVAPIASQVLARNARRLGRERGGESPLGSMVADAMRLEVKADLALQNSGGLRADLPEGVITRGSIYEVMPFENTLVTMELTGSQIRKVFEEGLAWGRVPQLSGVRLAFDMSRPRGNRVVMLAQADGQPLDNTFHYRVVTNNFMAGGGDNYETLSQGRNLVDTGVSVRDVLERFVVARAAENGGMLQYATDGRIRRSGPPSADLPR